MTTIDQIHPVRREHRGQFPVHTAPADLPAELRRVLTAEQARGRARARLNAWLIDHHLDPLGVQ